MKHAKWFFGRKKSKQRMPLVGHKRKLTGKKKKTDWEDDRRVLSGGDVNIL